MPECVQLWFHAWKASRRLLVAAGDAWPLLVTLHIRPSGMECYKRMDHIGDGDHLLPLREDPSSPQLTLSVVATLRCSRYISPAIGLSLSRKNVTIMMTHSVGGRWTELRRKFISSKWLLKRPNQNPMKFAGVAYFSMLTHLHTVRPIYLWTMLALRAEKVNEIKFLFIHPPSCLFGQGSLPWYFLLIWDTHFK